MSEEDKRTIGEICANDPCFSPTTCEFCKAIGEILGLEPLAPSSSSESLLNGSENTSILGEDEMKDSMYRELVIANYRL